MKKSNEYIPPKEIENIKTFQNLIYEIMGEAIISTVAETILKDLLKQYIYKISKKWYNCLNKKSI